MAVFSQFSLLVPSLALLSPLKTPKLDPSPAVMMEPVVGMPLLRPDINHDLASVLQELERILTKLPSLLTERVPERRAYEPNSFFKTYYEPTLMRLAMESPFLELRQKCLDFLGSAGSVTPTQPIDPEAFSSASAFLPNFTLFSLQVSDPDIWPKRECLLRDIFLRTGRMPHYHLIMAYFPDYLEKHHDLLKTALTERGPLSEAWRFYLAFMAAATHKCEYLMKLTEDRCRMYGGASSWFDAESLDTVPEKLRLLGNLNLKLAHRPWELDATDLQPLLLSFSVNELAQAVVILALYHSLSSFVLGVGVMPEFDQPFTKLRKLSMTAAAECLYSNKPDIALRLMNLEEALRDVSESTNGEDSELEEEEERDYCFEQLAGGALSYVNYDVYTSRRKFYVSDFNWRDQGFELLERMAPALARSVNGVIEHTYGMTSKTFGCHTNIETGPLRRAIWNYTQRVYGLLYDDYNYSEVNALLTKNTKTYIKKAACAPQTVNYDDFNRIELDISNEEKIHVVLLIAAGRMEGELLYWLHAMKTALGL